MTKKLITFLLVCLIVCTMAVNVMADETPVMTITVSSDTVNVGDTITVTVSISETANCTAAGLGIAYDTNAFEMVENSFTPLVNNTQATCKYNSVAKAYVANLQFEGAQTVSGVLFSFQLKVKESTAASNSCEISGTASIRINGANAQCNVTAASISFVCAHAYDNDCDTTCNHCGEKREVTHAYDDGVVTTEATCAAEGVKTCTCTGCGATKTEAIPVKDHTYDGGAVTTEATCTAPGVKTYTCTGTGCGATKTDDIPAKDHTYDGGVVTNEATCTAPGVKTYTCTGCGATETEDIPAKDHTYDNGVVTKEPTCKAKGVKTYTCTGCGETKTEKLSKLKHSYDEGTTTTEMTCTQDGVITYTCSLCSGTKTETLTAPGHSYDHECDPDCNTCGETRETEHEYSDRWRADENGHWHACEICADVQEVLAHNPGPEPTEETDQICLDCGFVLLPAGAHIHAESGDWLSDEENHWHLCECGEILDPQAHTWDEGTLDEAGSVMTYHCTVCGTPRTETVEQPTESVPPTEQTQPGTAEPETTAPVQTEPTAGDAQDQPAAEMPWWIVILAVGVLLVAAVIFIIVGILKSKKQTGKYSG